MKPRRNNAPVSAGRRDDRQVENRSVSIQERPAPARPVPSAAGERVLVVVPGGDAETVAGVLAEGNVTAHVCDDLSEACHELADAGVGVLLVAEEALRASPLQALAAWTRQQPPWSDLPVILLTERGGTREVSERTLELFDGSVTIVERPVRRLTLLNAVRVALRSRRRQYQVRDLLAGLQSAREREAAQRLELETLLEHVPAAVWIAHDPECRRISGNQAGYDLLRLPRGSNLSATASTPESPLPFKVRVNGLPVPPDQLPMQRVGRTGRPIFNREEELIFADGTSRWIYGHTVPLMNDRGRVRGVLSMFVDVTERKRIEQALEEKLAQLETVQAELVRQNDALLASREALEFEHDRYRELFDFAPDAYLVTDLRGLIQDANQQACRLFRQPRDFLLKVPLLPLFAPADRNKLLAFLPLVRERPAGKIDHVEATLRVPRHGHQMPCALTINAVTNYRGQVVGLRWLVRDISDRKRASENQTHLFELGSRVNRAEALPEIYDAALQAICKCLDADRASLLVYDADNVMRFKAWRGLSADYRQAVEGHSPWTPDTLDPAPIALDDLDAAPISEPLRSVIAREGIRALAFIPLTYERRLHGKFMVYYDTPHPFTAEELRLAQTIASQVALAMERRRSEERLERLVVERTAELHRSIEELQAVSYSLSHDMRAPLRAMRSFSLILQAQYGDRIEAEGRDLLERVISASGRLDRLIQDVLNYSRVSMARIDPAPVDVERLVRQILQEHPSFQPPHAIVELQSPLLPVRGHEASLTQCIYNLVNNAVKFVAPNRVPQVRIWSEPHDGRVRLWFEDNGIGIPSAAQSRLFRMFERIHVNEHYEGTGIGLAIVRKAAERMGGQVGVISEVGQGSRFWLLLPAAEA